MLRIRNLAENKTSCIPAGLQRSEQLRAAGLILIITKLALHVGSCSVGTSMSMDSQIMWFIEATEIQSQNKCTSYDRVLMITLC